LGKETISVTAIFYMGEEKSKRLCPGKHISLVKTRESGKKKKNRDRLDRFPDSFRLKTKKKTRGEPRPSSRTGASFRGGIKARPRGGGRHEERKKELDDRNGRPFTVT